MTTSGSTNSQPAPHAPGPKDMGFSPWQRLKTKRISYLTLPLLIMATITEFVILTTGWKYQQLVCLPPGMGVTFFRIGPIGATILAVELLKLPLAIWTASRHGWQKGFMLVVGLPLICILTFQLVKDMAVYEMGVALAPASQMLEKAEAEEVKIDQLNAELKGVQDKKAQHDQALAELAAKQSKARAELEDSIKRNDAAREDAISLTDYQKKELADVAARETTIIQQCDADAAQINKALVDLKAQRETEVSRASTWNVEEARIENDYKAKMEDYANKKAAYDKALAEYNSANFFKRQLMKEPVSPGVPPERESNKILKPTAIAELDGQIQAKEAELLAVNNRRRDGVAQVEADARRLRQEFDQRSTSKREEADRKRDELSASLAALTSEEKTERDQIDQQYEGDLQKVDGIRAQIETCRKAAEGYYEEREADIRKTQVYRIATTVEIIRAFIKGEHPMTIKLTAKQRGDMLTDQISMVRIWVYPVLAFIVAFLPTLMVEVGFSTVFEPEKQRPPHRLGFLGRRLHWLYTRAGRIKILRAERIAKEATAAISARDQALAAAQAVADKALVEKTAELQAAHEALSSANAAHEEQLKKKEEAWVAKLAGMADSLNRTVVEKDALRDLQKSEIERQIQMRQNAWSERLTHMRQELDEQRTASEAERTALMQEHHKKLLEVTEECKAQVIQARRQAADAELAAMEASARLTQDLKQAAHARDLAESQLKQQADSYSLKLSQIKEDAERELEKAIRQEKHRSERQQLEFNKVLHQREEEFDHRLKQREQELSLEFDARLADEQARTEQEARRREKDLESQFEARALEVDARWKEDAQQREEAAQIRLKQREQQLQGQAEARLNENQTRMEQELRRRESEFERQLEAQSREADTRLKQALQENDLSFQTRLKQREQDWATRAEARESELQKQWAAELRAREQDWERQAESRVRATETRLAQEALQKEEAFLTKSRQRDQQWQTKLDAAWAELQVQTDQVAQLTSQAAARQMAAQAQWEAESEKRTRAAIEPLKAQLARTEKERDEAKAAASEAARQVQSLEQQLTEATSFLTGRRNGKSLVATT